MFVLLPRKLRILGWYQFQWVREWDIVTNEGMFFESVESERNLHYATTTRVIIRNHSVLQSLNGRRHRGFPISVSLDGPMSSDKSIRVVCRWKDGCACKKTESEQENIKMVSFGMHLKGSAELQPN